MHKTIILSGKRDPDLVSLYRMVGSKEFTKLMKEALRMAVRPGYKPVTKLPEGFTLQAPENNEDIRVDLCVTSAKDADVEEVLSHVLPRELGLFAKQAMRFSMGAVSVLQAYLDADFTQKIVHNPLPTQVFSIEGAVPTKQKRSSATGVRRPKKPAVCATPVLPPSLPKPETVHAPNVPSFGDTEPAKEPKPATSEEDEMLALLEGLLG